jgi:hypothetical protein
VDSAEAVPPPPPPPRLDSLPHPGVFRTAGTNPIDWKGFLRLAVPLGVLVGIFTPASPLPGSLVLLPASVFVAVHFYRKRHLLPLKASQGAKLGAMIGLLGFAIQAVIEVSLLAHDPEYRRAREEQFREAVANSSTPQARETMEALIDKVGVVRLTVLSLPILLAFLLTISGVSGALAATLPRNRSGP